MIAEPFDYIAGRTHPPFNKPSAVPKEFAWPSLLARAGRLPFLKAFTGELI
jgi:hypothetical protein